VGAPASSTVEVENPKLRVLVQHDVLWFDISMHGCRLYSALPRDRHWRYKKPGFFISPVLAVVGAITLLEVYRLLTRRSSAPDVADLTNITK